MMSKAKTLTVLIAVLFIVIGILSLQIGIAIS